MGVAQQQVQVATTPNFVFCFGPKLWFWPRPKLNNKLLNCSSFIKNSALLLNVLQCSEWYLERRGMGVIYCNKLSVSVCTVVVRASARPGEGEYWQTISILGQWTVHRTDLSTAVHSIRRSKDSQVAPLPMITHSRQRWAELCCEISRLCVCVYCCVL